MCIKDVPDKYVLSEHRQNTRKLIHNTVLLRGFPIWDEGDLSIHNGIYFHDSVFCKHFFLKIFIDWFIW